jgi:hypothetical protein
MHTSQTTHHRIFFANVTKPDYLEGLCLDLGFEKVSDTIYDLVLDEGHSMSVEGACRIAVKVAALGNAEGDPEDLQFMLGALARLLAERGYTPHSTTFDADVDLELLVDQDISCLELFDLLSALSYGYEVRGIYSQWAMNSSKAEFGAHAGGTRITMRDFSIPCQVYPNDAEGLIHLLAQHSPENIGDIYLMKLILPLIEMPGILNKTMELSVHAALARFLGGVPQIKLYHERPNAPVPDIGPDPLAREYTPPIAPALIAQTFASMQRQGIDPKDIEIKGVKFRDSKPLTPNDFRNFQPAPLSGIPVDLQFYLLWYGYSPLSYIRGELEIACDMEKISAQVQAIRESLECGDDSKIPPMGRFNEQYISSPKDPVLRPDDVLERGRSTMLSQTGFEQDAVPFDRGVLQDIHNEAAGMARSSQRDVIDRETHRPTSQSEPGIPSVMVLEKTGPDYSEVSSSRQSFAEPSPSPSPDNSPSSSDNSTSSFD